MTSVNEISFDYTNLTRHLNEEIFEMINSHFMRSSNYLTYRVMYRAQIYMTNTLIFRSIEVISVIFIKYMASWNCLQVLDITKMYRYKIPNFINIDIHILEYMNYSIKKFKCTISCMLSIAFLLIFVSLCIIKRVSIRNILFTKIYVHEYINSDCV